MSQADRPLGISTWAIRNPVPVVVLFIALTLAGLIAYGGLPVKLFPDVQFPAVTVTVTRTRPGPGRLGVRLKSAPHPQRPGTRVGIIYI